MRRDFDLGKCFQPDNVAEKAAGTPAGRERLGGKVME